VTSHRKIQANRANARRSIDPKTTQGRACSAKNAFRHGLSLPVNLDPAFSEEAEAMTRQIAGPDAEAEMLALARHIAEAQIDLGRVRYARHHFLPGALNDPYCDSRANVRDKGAVVRTTKGFWQNEAKMINDFRWPGNPLWV
jgi:hypothetical protein